MIRPPLSESVPGILRREKMYLPLEIIKIRVVLLKLFFKMCLADTLQDATDCGGLNNMPGI